MLRWSFIFALLPALVSGDDWPQWMGPNRDGTYSESGIIREIPEQGLNVLWRTPIQGGYAGPAVQGQRVFVTDYVRKAGEAVNDPSTRNELQGNERVLSLDAKTGEILWKHEYDCPYAISYACGPRATPTLDGGLVYTLGAEGHLFCLNQNSGEVLWSKLLTKAYKAETPIWGFAAHPLIYQDLLICVVGGPGSVAVAFNKMTGEEVWRAGSASEQGYCPPTLIDVKGEKQLIVWDADKLNCLNPKSGELIWQQPLKPNYGMSIAAPRYSDGILFASGIGKVGVTYNVTQNKATELWKGDSKNAVYSANSTPIVDNGTIYGVDCHTGGLRAVDQKSGEVLWENFTATTGDRRRGHGTAFLVKSGDRFLIFSETGDLIIASLTREGYQEHGRYHVLEPTGEAFGRNVVWSHPAFANKCCFARNDKEIVCVSLASAQ